jgi:O-antigen/teichoic acid export membrane protein
VLVTAATNAVLAVIGLITGVLAARLLGPEGRGHLAAAVAAGSLVGAIGALALGESLVFFVGRRVRPPMVVLRTATLVGTVSMVVLIALAWVAMPWVLAGQPGAVDAARAYAFIGLPFVLAGFPITLVRALQRYGAWNLLRLLAPLCWLAVLGFFTLTRNRTVAELAVAFVAAQMLAVPLVWSVARGPKRTRGSVDLTLVRPMLRYGAPLLVATLPLTLNLRFDQILIANMEAADQLGLYAVSVSWAAIGLPLMAAIGSVLFPRLAAMEPGDAQVVLARSSRCGVVIALVIAVVSAFSAPTLVPLLFGRSFTVPFLLPVMLALATSVLGLNGIIEEGLRGLGEPRSVLVAELAGLAVTALLLFGLVPTVGITGAAVASLAGYATVTATLAWRIRVRNQIQVSDLLVPRRSDLLDMIERGRATAARRGE